MFASDGAGRAVASRITILAVPGATFVFDGNISYLDASAGRMTLVDPRDEKSYQISFDPADFPVSTQLHLGRHVTVTASYNGASYVASRITAY